MSEELPGLRCGVLEGHEGHVILRPGDRHYWCNGNARPEPESWRDDYPDVHTLAKEAAKHGRFDE